MPCSGVMMSLKRMAASSSKRRSGCRVTSAASSGVRVRVTKSTLRAQLAVLGQIAPGLAHDPDRAYGGTGWRRQAARKRRRATDLLHAHSLSHRAIAGAQ